MALVTYDTYRDRLVKMRPNVYLHGKKVDRSGDFMRGGLYCLKQTFDCALDPKYEDVVTATSHLSGEKISRFTHIHQSVDDLLKKQLMTKLLCHRVGGCIQRCMGVDALNALAVVTYDCDQANGTGYYERFLKLLRYWQDNDLVGCCAQTDVKGVRGLRPSEQPDPGQYLRIVEVKSDGVIVRGAKVCNSMAPYADEIVALPTRFMGPKEAEYAVAFSLPADWDGIKLMALPGLRHNRVKLTSPDNQVGDVESLTIFDDVFVPNERLFMNGLEHPDVVQYAGYLALMFAHFHRHSYTGCKTAVSEVIASQAALVADVNGITKYPHVQEKISHIIGTAELVFAAGQMSAYRAVRFPNGSYVPDEILTNAGRRLAGQEIYREYEILADLTGGICASLPTEESFYDPETADLMAKYVTRNPKYTAEEAHRVFRMMEDKLCDSFSGAQMVAGVHGGGSPVMETITMMARYDLEPLKEIAKYLAGINPDLPRYERPTATPRAMLDKFKKTVAEKKDDTCRQ
ncbi:MAG: aromatic ring hydroxylase [Actinomycetia bacterium]|nr:aromatic ring hydroxylase [Actinomycetes bacterium]